MAKLSAHGVRLILPALLRAIDDQQSWRTKAGKLFEHSGAIATVLRSSIAFVVFSADTSGEERKRAYIPLFHP